MQDTLERPHASSCGSAMDIEGRDVATPRSRRLMHRSHRSLLQAHWLQIAVLVACVLAVAPPGTIWHSGSGVLLVRGQQPPRPRMSTSLHAPIAVPNPSSFRSACGVHTDPYGWLKDDSRTDLQVLSHLRAENTYAAAQLATLAPLQQQLQKELQERLPPVHVSGFQQHGGWLYFEQRAQGQAYADVYRVPAAAGGGGGYAALAAALASRATQSSSPAAQPAHGSTATSPSQPAAPAAARLVLSRNNLAAGQTYFDLYRHVVSAVGWVAYLVDLVGDEQYRLQIADIATGRQLLPQPLPGCTGDVLWSSDGSTCWVTAEGGRVLAVHLHPAAAAGATSPSAAAAAGGGLEVVVYQVYRAAADESISSMHATTDGRYIVLKSKIEGNGHVHVLDMAHSDMQALSSSSHSGMQAPTSGSGSSSTSRSRASQRTSAGQPYNILQRRLPWQLLLPWREEVDVLKVEHAGNNTFLLLVDSDAAPDGQLLALTLGDSGGGGGKAALLTSSLPNVLATDTPADPPSGQGGTSSTRDGASVQPPIRLPLEVVDFLVGGSHLVVLLRVNCSCRVWVFDLPPSPGSSSTNGSSPLWGWLEPGASDTADILGQPDWDIPINGTTLVVSLQALHSSAASGHGLLTLRVTSLVTPPTILECDLVTRTQAVRYVQPVLGGFQREQYVSELRWATSADGVQVPMTVAWRRDLLKGTGHNPAILKGYGAYGSSQWPAFSASHLLLLDRGWVLAVAHVRGGGELGSRWTRGGKGLRKTATFEDLLAAAGRLVQLGFTSRPRLALWGRSAGGLAVGAALNLDPACCGAALLDVPFLDVLGDMCDEGQLLTIQERGEWGDPLNDEVACEYIASYSPYQNLQPRPSRYPRHMLLTGSLQDRRVNYWQPLKYAARMRELHGDDSQNVLVMTDEHAGHFSASGADAQEREELQKFAFLLHAFRLV